MTRHQLILHVGLANEQGRLGANVKIDEKGKASKTKRTKMNLTQAVRFLDIIGLKWAEEESKALENEFNLMTFR